MSESDSAEVSDSGDNLESDNLELQPELESGSKHRKSAKSRSKKKAIAVAPPKIPHLEGGLPAFLSNPLGPMSPQDPEKGSRFIKTSSFCIHLKISMSL